MRWPLLEGRARALAVYGAAALLGLAGALVLYFFPPAETWWYPKCPSWVIFGIYCPGCGTARALWCLVHGDFLGACRKNIVMVLTLPLMAWCFVELLRYIAEGRPCSKFLENTRFWQSFVILLFVYAILRNIPVYPFMLLAPH